MRHLMAAQLAGQHALMKMLLYKRDGSAFWAMVASCPLAACKQASATVPHSAAAARVVQQQQQHPGSSSGSGEAANISSTGSGGSSATSQLLLLLDITSSHARRVGKYALGRVLGAGASGVVHIGKHTETGEGRSCRAEQCNCGTLPVQCGCRGSVNQRLPSSTRQLTPGVLQVTDCGAFHSLKQLQLHVGPCTNPRQDI